MASRIAWIAVVLALVASGSVLAQLRMIPRKPQQPLPTKPVAPSASEAKFDPNAWEMRLADGKTQSIKITEPIVTIATEFGTVKVPNADIRRIEFGVKLSPADQKLVDESLKAVASKESKDRERGKAALLELGQKAYPFVLRAIKTADRDASPHLVFLADRLKPKEDPLAEIDFELRDYDLVFAADGSKFAGKLLPDVLAAIVDGKDAKIGRGEATVLVHANSAAVPVKYDVVASINGCWETHLNKTVAIEVTAGLVGSSVWGSNPYTSDSYLPMAAIHAGVLKDGETATILLKILPDPGSYTGSTKHGITSSNYGVWRGCYQIVGKLKKATK